jgi:hypothetical protein
MNKKRFLSELKHLRIGKMILRDGSGIATLVAMWREKLRLFKRKRHPFIYLKENATH